MLSQTDKAALSKSIFSDRFELRPMGWIETSLQIHVAEQDDKIRALLYHREKPRKLLKILLKTKGSKPPKRIFHKIVSRTTGKAIGYHATYKLKYDSATMAVVIYDQEWWGTGAVVEIRKAIITTFQEVTGVKQFCAEVHSRNFASILNYNKLGFEIVGVKYSCVFDEIRGEPADYLSFSLRGENLENNIDKWKFYDA